MSSMPGTVEATPGRVLTTFSAIRVAPAGTLLCWFGFVQTPWKSTFSATSCLGRESAHGVCTIGARGGMPVPHPMIPQNTRKHVWTDTPRLVIDIRDGLSQALRRRGFSERARAGWGRAPASEALTPRGALVSRGQWRVKQYSDEFWFPILRYRLCIAVYTVRSVFGRWFRLLGLHLLRHGLAGSGLGFPSDLCHRCPRHCACHEV